jgi:hypothetical protein
LRRAEGEPLRLPPGYRLDRSDPDVWAGGWVVAYFSAQGATSEEAVERIAWEDYSSAGEEEYP